MYWSTPAAVLCLNPFSQGVVQQDGDVTSIVSSLSSLNPFSQGVVQQDEQAKHSLVNEVLS